LLAQFSGVWAFEVPDVGDERLNKSRLESQSCKFFGQTQLTQLLISSKLVQIDGFLLQPRGMAPGFDFPECSATM
jgi:hypothetical protein